MTNNPYTSIFIWLIITIVIYGLCVLLNNIISKKIKLSKITSLYVASIIIILLINYSGTSYEEYDKAGKIISYMLYPATVALALPLYKNRKGIWSNLPEVATATVVSTLVSVLSIYIFAKCARIDDVLIRSLVTKCITTPVAIETTKIINGIEGIAFCAVSITGIVGAFFGHYFLKLLKIKNDTSIGLAIGSTSHVIGTAKCLEKNQKQASLSALVLITTALFSALFICTLFYILSSLFM